MQNIQMQMSWENLRNTVWYSAYRSEKTLYLNFFWWIKWGVETEHLSDRNWYRWWFIWCMITSLAILYHYICISSSFSICDQLLSFINTVYPTFCHTRHVDCCSSRTEKVCVGGSCLFICFPCWKTSFLSWIITCGSINMSFLPSVQRYGFTNCCLN